MDQRAIQAASARIDELQEKWKKRHSGISEPLYHYTDANGLLGILTSGKLWATEIRFLNDPSELTYGLSIVHEALERASQRRGLDFDAIRTWLASSLDLKEQLTQVYVVSFCADGDLLSQWRAYGGSGDGCSIEFSAECFRGLRKVIYCADEQECFGGLRKVIYCADEQERYAAEWADAACDLFESHGPARQVPDGLERLHWEIVCTCKNPEYADEREWRVVYFPKCRNEIKFRCRGNMAVPYVELSFQQRNVDRPVTLVRLGPAVDTDQGERSVRQMLFAKGYTQAVKVVPSEIPLRKPG